MYNNKYLPKLLVNGFFVAILIIGLIIFRDYGISADEEVERRLGIININFIADLFHIDRLQNDHILKSYRFWPSLTSYYDHAFGPLFAIFSVLIERVFQINSDREIYYFRHLLTFSIFYISLISFYKIASRRFVSWKWGLLATLFLLLSPRIFADSFYNPKDIIFLSFFIIATNASINFLKKGTITTAIAAGFTIGLAIDVRPMAIVLLLMILMMILWVFISSKISKNEIDLKHCIYSVSVLLVTVVATTLFFWPWLWVSPFEHFIEALSAFSRWVRSDLWGLYNGNLVRSTQLPWHYVPVWIAVTTPFFYLPLFIIGVVRVVGNLIKAKFIHLQSFDQIQDIIFFGLFFLPIFAVIFLNSVVYDGWRHLYFIYPAFLMLCMLGINFLWVKFYCLTNSRVILASCLFGGLFYSAYWMIGAHPYQNAYFNFLAGKNLKTNWELDYWGLSNVEQIKYILSNDERKVITVRPGSFTNVELALRMIEPSQGARIHMVDELDEADYLISNHRYKDAVFVSSNSDFNVWREIIVDKEVISTILKRNIESPLVLKTPIVLGKPLVFSKDSFVASLLKRGGGWAEPEILGAWSLGDNARLVLPFPKAAKVLCIKVKPFVIDPSEPQIIEVRLNKNDAKKFTFINSEPVELEIPLLRSQVDKDSVSLNFHFYSPRRPNDLGISNDNRLLSIKILSIVFK